MAQQSEDFRNKRASKAAAARKAEQTSQKMTSTDKPRGIEGAIKSLDKNGKKLNDFIGVLSMFK
ncbi:hypothetical protein GCM10007938_07010 [Vibrio zhanjiangensis]|uniref:Uncharacterized protein n=1 Tax=Vibrio zhanjiangensis TaxID=1046128 RepID=A0ABQ6EVU4_9VIBR|nr:hypothetical protein GCM10007938_07010 [Vibrio zhanjiangensis]